LRRTADDSLLGSRALGPRKPHQKQNGNSIAAPQPRSSIAGQVGVPMTFSPNRACSDHAFRPYRTRRQLGSHAPPLGPSGGRAHAALLPRRRPSCLGPAAHPVHQLSGYTPTAAAWPGLSSTSASVLGSSSRTSLATSWATSWLTAGSRTPNRNRRANG
jgi:hypothetical protein